MLTQNEKEQIASHLKQKKELPSNLKEKFDAIIQANKSMNTSGADEYLCCDTGLTPPDRYIWTTFDNCRALNGRAADKSMCGL
jgi:hypothetical protein